MSWFLNFQIFVLVFVYNFYFGRANMYLAMTDMEDLLDTEKAIIDGLEQYIKIEERNILELKSKKDEYQKEYKEAKNSSTSYILNPISAYLLTKHLTEDWKNVEGIIQEGGKMIENMVNKSNGLKFPTPEDLDGAATALIRLQNIYNLDAEDVAKGLLNGIKFNKELSAKDCFQIGKSAYEDNNCKRTIHWMKVALQKLPLQETNNLMIPWVTKADILGYLAFCIYKEGDIKTALELTKELIELEPDNAIATNNIKSYEREMRELKENGIVNEIINIPESEKNFSELSFMEKYGILCRGDYKPTPNEERNLKCAYIDNEIPYLKIGPIKCEQVLNDPVILIFHDVIYDSEIEQIKKLSKPKLNRASVFGNAKPKVRIGKTGWLYPREDKNIENVLRRAGLMSRLNMQSSEPLQICNYGIGGHYEPHVDYSDDPEAFEHDRTATILFYMTDVQQGGATVFTELKRTVWPKKGSAVFWYNLDVNGKGNPKTRHASCPVLTGTKWVANLWVHETGQVCYAY